MGDSRHPGLRGVGRVSDTYRVAQDRPGPSTSSAPVHNDADVAFLQQREIGVMRSMSSPDIPVGGVASC
jgi:hypothetical protein